MCRLSVLLCPTVGIPCGVMHYAALDDDGVEVFVVAENTGLVVLAPTLLILAAPFADITTLNDDVVATEEMIPCWFTFLIVKPRRIT